MTNDEKEIPNPKLQTPEKHQISKAVDLMF